MVGIFHLDAINIQAADTALQCPMNLVHGGILHMYCRAQPQVEYRRSIKWVMQEPIGRVLLHMHADGLQVLDSTPAAILMQLLQHAPLAPMPCNNMHAMFKFNCARAPNFAAFNKAADDTVSVHMLFL